MNHWTFITYSYLTISLNVGLFKGSLSQHFFINLAKGSGVFFGICGLNSLYSTA